MSWVKPKPLAKRRHCFEVTSGSTPMVACSPRSTRPRCARSRPRSAAIPEIEAVAVCLLFSYLNPEHERRVKEILAAELPDKVLSISYEVLPKWKEYERASTTIADAYLKPIVSRQLAAMRERLDEAEHHGAGGDHQVERRRDDARRGRRGAGQHGALGADRRRDREPLRRPGSRHRPPRHARHGRHLDRRLDRDRRPESFTTAFEIEWGVPIQIPMVDIRTIGAGGGSIAWIDKGGMLQVGPQSAGAQPGPACYGSGGTEADGHRRQPGARPDQPRLLPRRPDAARRRRGAPGDRAASPRQLGQDVEATALAIARIVDTNMIGALRSVLIERGLDPRDFTLCAFGGATPLHASSLIREMGIPRAIVPIHPGAVLGLRLHPDRCPGRPAAHHPADQQAVRHCGRQPDHGGAGRRERRASSSARATARTSRSIAALEMRYLGQNYELELPVPFERFDPATIEQLWQRFHEAHEARFGFAIPGEIIEIVTYTVTAIAPTPKPDAAADRDRQRHAGAQGAAPGLVRRRRPRRAGLRPREPALRAEHRRGRRWSRRRPR